MEDSKSLFEYILRIADNSLILGHRVSEWCGHGPSLETDIGLTNIALDLVGHARTFLQYAAQVENKSRTDDDLAFLRDVRDFKNVLIVEQANGNFANTIARQFLFDTFNYYFYEALMDSKDEELASIAKKSIKEVAYHYRYSAEWVIRLGDGTDESYEKMQAAINDIWIYTDEMFEMDKLDEQMLNNGIGVNLDLVKTLWNERITQVLKEAFLTRPEAGWMQRGGRQGKHTEQLGYILTEMQWMQRAYPGLKW